jgi:alkylation response protein AidB-like acyl-CoA dehydrogenase
MTCSDDVFLTTEQIEIRSLVREVLGNLLPMSQVRQAAHSGLPDLGWEQVIGNGWAGINLPEVLGGAGLGMLERQLVTAEIGRSLAAASYLGNCVLPSDVLELLAASGARSELLPQLCSGRHRYSVVDGRAGAPFGRVFATDGDEGWILSGVVEFVMSAPESDMLLVLAGTGHGETGLFLVPAAHAQIDRTSTLDITRSFGEVRLTDAAALRIDGGALEASAMRTYERRRNLALAAEMLATGFASADIALDFVKLREQFGRPVGSFQAIKHRLAHAWIKLDAASQLLFAALDAVGDESFADMLAAAACTVVDEASDLAVSECIQFHGGMGFTWEIDAHLYYRRRILLAALLGDREQQLDDLATALEL